MINWKNRYAQLLRLLPELADPACTVLEAGAGGSGIARYLGRPVVAVDLDAARWPTPGSWNIAADVGRLPFLDRAFDVLICLDTFEHLPVERRERALREMARVTRRRLVISAPMGAFATWGDQQYWLLRRWRRQATPGWLEQHLLHGIPALGEMLAMVARLEISFRLQGNETLIQHYAGLLADEAPFLAEANSALEFKRSTAPPLGTGVGDVYYSYLIDIDKVGAGDTVLVPPPLAPARLSEASNQIRLYSVGHDPHRFPSFSSITRFFAGSAPPEGTNTNRSFIIDDQAESIRDKNAAYSELTAIYSVWRNRRHGRYVGFCHYRRYFDFLSTASGAMRMTTLSTPQALAAATPSINAVESWRQSLESGVVLVPMPEDLTPTVAEHYMRHHHPDHYLRAIEIALKRHPHLQPYVLSQFSAAQGYTNNMFVCTADFFDELCAWWFDLLFDLEGELDPLGGSYQKRATAFLAERLLDIYLSWRFATGTPHRELPLFFLEEGAFVTHSGAGLFEATW